MRIVRHAEDMLRFYADNQIHDVNLDMTQLQHIAVIYNDNDDRFTFWVNGILEYTVKNVISLSKQAP